MTNFETFKTEFSKWQTIFGLNGYAVFFECCDVGGGFADITMNRKTMVITVRLDTKTPRSQVKLSAKHEAIHLLLNRLQAGAYDRHITEDEIYSAVEEIVYKLEKLI